MTPHEAVSKKDVRSLNRLIDDEGGWDGFVRLWEGSYEDRSYLHHAAENGGLSVVKRLVELGADADELDDEGRTPLERAFIASKERGRAKADKEVRKKIVDELLPLTSDADVVERTFGWVARRRRLARDYERLTQTLAAYHWVVVIGILLARIQLAPSA